MKKISLLILLLTGISLLTGCSVRSDAADLYKKEVPLQVKVDMPESISANQTITVEAILTQAEKKVEKADFVHFEVWKKDGSVRFPMEEAEEVGNGRYRMEFQFESDGLYYLNVHAGSKGAISSPQRQFIVGELSDSEIAELKEGPVKEKANSSHHH